MLPVMFNLRNAAPRATAPHNITLLTTSHHITAHCIASRLDAAQRLFSFEFTTAPRWTAPRRTSPGSSTLLDAPLYFSFPRDATYRNSALLHAMHRAATFFSPRHHTACRNASLRSAPRRSHYQLPPQRSSSQLCASRDASLPLGAPHLPASLRTFPGFRATRHYMSHRCTAFREAAHGDVTKHGISHLSTTQRTFAVADFSPPRSAMTAHGDITRGDSALRATTSHTTTPAFSIFRRSAPHLAVSRHSAALRSAP